jgi:hypothetical protein
MTLRHCGLLLTIGSLIPAMPAIAGTEVSHYRVKDQAARAEYSWTAGCVTTSIQVKAALTRVKEDGTTPETTGLASVTIGTVDFCDPQVRIQKLYYGETSSFTLQVDGDIRFARLFSPAFPISELVPDGNGGVVTTAPKYHYIDMTWTSNDPLERTAGAITTSGPGYHEVSSLTGHYRLADVSGTLSDGTQNLLPLPASGVYGFFQILKLTNGSITITSD